MNNEKKIKILEEKIIWHFDICYQISLSAYFLDDFKSVFWYEILLFKSLSMKKVL